jgi:outer membrane protein OmpA-like peptidoglycan-associated protein
MPKKTVWLLGSVAVAAAMASFPREAWATDCTVGPWMVFFDWNKDEITPEGRATLDSFFGPYRSCADGSTIYLVGHADRSGPDGYNVSLSRRRAERIRAYLTKRGIPEALIRTAALGESRPLEETGDGIRSRLNRRVEIAIGPPPASQPPALASPAVRP